jgi:hypothetical protein
MNDLILYTTEDGRSQIKLRARDQTVWLSQREMAQLFDVSTDNVGLHLKNIFADGELSPEATTEESSVVQIEGSREVQRPVTLYNLDAILAVGYRVRSPRGVQFRQWASQRLSEYLVKGFAMDDERLKRGPDDGYFEELLARIRDIRSSERMFWRKVLDIYATSIDYDPAAEASQRFFQTVQNKMHWAAHGHTAAEVVVARADAGQPNMGMTSTSADQPRKQDAPIAKNYLQADELEALNRIVTAYLEFAELQALNRQPMTMAGWIAKLDDFLRLSGRELLTHGGRVSHADALQHAQQQYDLWRKQRATLPQAVDRDFDAATQALKPIATQRKAPRTPKDHRA